MNFSDLIRGRVQAEMEGRGVPEGPFLRVLQELAQGLASEEVGAAITRGSFEPRFYLTLWPRTLPAMRQLMLAFWVTSRSVRVFVDPPQEFHKVREFRSWLADYVTNPAFIETLRTLVEASRQPVEGYLRARGSGQLSREDVVTYITPDEQKKLVDLAGGAPVSFMAKISDKAGVGEFDANRQYVAFECSGVIIEPLITVEPVDDQNIRIMGGKRVEQDLEWAR